MNEPFVLEVNYQNVRPNLQAAFQRYGFNYRIAVRMKEATYIFEKDEAGDYQVLPDGQEDGICEKGLLKAVAVKLKQL